MTTLKQTPSQTVGPYFAYGLVPEQYNFDLKSLFTASAADREVPGEQLRAEQVHVAGERADADLAVLLADVGELREVVDVDQVLGAGEPQLHHRQQAVAAGDDPRLGAEPLERRDGALDARRTLVLEWRGGLQRGGSFLSRSGLT